jgi:hypothetical protein
MLAQHLQQKFDRQQQRERAEAVRQRDHLAEKAAKSIREFFEYDGEITIIHLWPSMRRVRFLLEGNSFEITYENEHLFRYRVSYMQEEDGHMHYIRLVDACDLLPYLETA